MISVKIEKFSGPLDLLLKIVEKEELDITRISLAKIAEDYISYIKNSPEIKPDEMADFLVVAARLLYLKSRALFPYLNPEESEEGESLEEQLKMYRKFAEAAKKVKKMIESGNFMYNRPFGKIVFMKRGGFYPPRKLTARILGECFRRLVKSVKPREKLDEEQVEAVINIEEKIERIRLEIISRARFTFSELLQSAADKIEMIVSFLAILELIKQKTVSADQEGIFGEITIAKLEKI